MGTLKEKRKKPFSCLYWLLNYFEKRCYSQATVKMDSGYASTDRKTEKVKPFILNAFKVQFTLKA